MKYPFITIFLFLVTTSFASPEIKIYKKLPPNLVIKNLAIWPINCDELNNCNDLREEIDETLDYHIDFNTVLSDSIVSFYEGEVPQIIDSNVIQALEKRFNIDAILIPTITKATSTEGNAVVGTQIGNMMIFSGMGDIETKVSIKILLISNKSIVANGFGEDVSGMKTKIRLIEKVFKDLIEELF